MTVPIIHPLQGFAQDVQLIAADERRIYDYFTDVTQGQWIDASVERAARELWRLGQLLSGEKPQDIPADGFDRIADGYRVRYVAAIHAAVIAADAGLADAAVSDAIAHLEAAEDGLLTDADLDLVRDAIAQFRAALVWRFAQDRGRR